MTTCSQEELRSPQTPFDVAVWRKLAKRNFADYVQAVLRRLAWLDEHDAELVNAHLARLRLTTLLRVLYSIKVPYTEPDLRALLDLTVPLLGRIAPYGPVECVVEYLKSNDLTPGLCRSLRDFQAHLREEMSVSQASMQSLRQQLHMLLWLDEWDAARSGALLERVCSPRFPCIPGRAAPGMAGAVETLARECARTHAGGLGAPG